MWDYIATAPMNLIGKDKNNPLRIKLSFSLHFLVPWILAQGSLMLFPQAPIEPCVTLILCSFICRLQHDLHQCRDFLFAIQYCITWLSKYLAFVNVWTTLH